MYGVNSIRVAYTIANGVQVPIEEQSVVIRRDSRQAEFVGNIGESVL